jgi:hypothetical protein
MSENLTDLDKEYPDFLRLIEEANFWGLEGIPKFQYDNYGLPTPANALIQYQAMMLGFKKYLLKIHRIENVTTKEEALKYWNPSFFTLKNLIEWISHESSEQNEIRAKYEEGVSFLNGELKRILPKPERKFKWPEMAFLIIYEKRERPAKNENPSLYKHLRYWREQSNRVKNDPENNKYRIKMFERMISELSPDAKIWAESEFKELKQNIDLEKDKLN